MHRSKHTITAGPAWYRLVVHALVAAALLVPLSVVARAPAAEASPYCPPEDYPCDTPDPTPPPPSPATVRLYSRTDTSVTVRWTTPTDATGSQLQRLSGSTWAAIYTRLGTGTVTRTDTDRARDTQYCYRVRTFNDYGSRYSNPLCVYTKDGRALQAYRVQMRITTGNVSDGGTDDDVSVWVAGPASTTGGRTWLDHARDDFEGGDTHSYDLVLKGVTELGDVEALAVEQRGSDDWCLRGFAVVVNGVVAYSQAYASCVWMGSDTGRTAVSVPHATLRASASWRSFVTPLPPYTIGANSVTARVTIPRAELEQRIESSVGHSIHGTSLYWGHLYGRGVEVTRRISSIADVDLDLARDMFGPDPEVDVNFQLAASARVVDGDAHVDLQTQNVDVEVDFPWWADVLDTLVPCGPVATVITGDAIPFCLDAVATRIETRVAAQFPALQEHLGLDGPVSSVSAVFDSSSNFVITVVFPR